MTTALEDWGRTQGQSQDAAGQQANLHIDDSEPRNTDDSDLDRFDVDEGKVQETAVDAEVEARAARSRKQVKQILIGGGIFAGAVAALMVVSVLKKSDQAAQMAQAEVVAPVAQAAQIPQVGMQPGVLAGTVGELGRGDQAAQLAPVTAAPDFGLQAAAPVAVAPLTGQPGAAQVDLDPALGGRQIPAQPVDMGQTGTTALKSSSISAPALAVNPSSNVATGLSAKSEVDQLRADIAELRAAMNAKEQDVSNLRQEVTSLKGQGGAKPVVARTVAPKRPVAKAKSEADAHEYSSGSPAVVVVTERVSDRAGTTSSALSAQPPTPSVSQKGKVRTDFRIYAAVDGRFWVVGPDNEPVQVGTASPLSDGTRITSIDSDKNVIHTSAGEIR